MDIVRIVDCEDADDFLEHLSPRGPLFGSTEAVGSHAHMGDAWVFRGHTDDEYLLMPSALRNESAFEKFDDHKCSNNVLQIRAEMNVLRRFFNLADTTGLPLPEDSQVLRASIQNLFTLTYFKELEDGNEIWPPLNLWSLLGIAQHYGIPTRLMDWTRKAKVASYFAASGAAQKLAEMKNDAQRLEIGEKKKLCVWAFAFDKYSSYFDPDYGVFHWGVGRTPPPAPVVKITAPQAHNPNLHAQDGLFSLHRTTLQGKLNQSVDRSPLELIVEQSLEEISSHKPLFFRIRLSWKESRHLMWRLMQEGVGHATIYPGYAGVVAALKEETGFL